MCVCVCAVAVSQEDVGGVHWGLCLHFDHRICGEKTSSANTTGSNHSNREVATTPRYVPSGEPVRT